MTPHTSCLNHLLDVFEKNAPQAAIVWRDRSFTYRWMLDRIGHWRGRLESERVAAGTVAILEADFSPDSVSLLLALVERNCILVPLTRSVAAKKETFIRIAQGELVITIDDEDRTTLSRLPQAADHGHYRTLRALGHPGLVLFSSGSTGESKGVVHDITGLLEKFRIPRKRLRTITFLLYDHIGGINTLLYTLSNGGCLVTVQDRNPDSVLAAVERHRVELLPTSPTFMNLVLLSEAWKTRDLSSLRTVTYGTEPMPQSTLERFHAAMPDVELLQTYGLSEIGILRSKSRSSDSLWVRLGGEGFDLRVVDGMLEIKARSAMLGYLNAPSPFTPDGWLRTGDAVETDGEYVRILGRRSEMINVGGEKVFPAEVEGVLQLMDGVAEVVVHGQPNAITGHMVCAEVRLTSGEPVAEFRTRMRAFCKSRLAPYKIPQKVVLVEEPLHGGRFKKMRPPTGDVPAAEEEGPRR